MTADIDRGEIEADRAAGTPGPWDVSAVRLGRAIVNKSGHTVAAAHLHGPGIGHNGRRDANARRIARVPDLEAAYLAALDEIERLREVQDARLGEMEEALNRIVQWADAYPVSVFPEPDFAKAAEVLANAGMTLDAILAAADKLERGE